MNFIFGSVTLNYNPIFEDYQMSQVKVCGSERRALDGTLLSDNVIYKKQWTITGVCDSQLEELLDLDGNFTFANYDGNSYTVRKMSLEVIGYPEEHVGKYTLSIIEV